MKNALLLGRGGRAVNVLNWKDAVLLAYFRNNVVFALDWHDHYVYSQKDKWQIPSVLMLTGKKDQYPDYDKLPLNKHNVLMRDNWVCQYCGKKLSDTTATIDHVFPLGRNGTNTWRNVVAACKPCNNKKDKMTAPEFEEVYGLKLKRKPFVPNRAVIFSRYVSKPEYKTWVPFLEKYLKKAI